MGKLDQEIKKHIKNMKLFALFAADAEDDDARINANDPCSCLSGATGGYKSFFNRLAKANGFENEEDFKGGYRRGEAQKIQKAIINNNLNAHYGCKVPNKN